MSAFSWRPRLFFHQRLNRLQTCTYCLPLAAIVLFCHAGCEIPTLDSSANDVRSSDVIGTWSACYDRRMSGTDELEGIHTIALLENGAFDETLNTPHGSLLRHEDNGWLLRPSSDGSTRLILLNSAFFLARKGGLGKERRHAEIQFSVQKGIGFEQRDLFLCYEGEPPICFEKQG